jgi:uncharacterized protein YggE
MSVRKTSVLVVLAILALAAAVVLSSGVLPANAAANAGPAAQAATPAPVGQVVPRTITVVGRGEVKVKPDVANTTVGVEALGATVDAAMADAEARMTSVLAALKAMGIADKDIQTSNFSVNFERQSEPQPTTRAQATPGAFEPPAGFYRVSNMVQVTVRDMDTVGDVIDTAVEAGANNVWGINFALESTDALEVQAREAAVKDAQARAQSLAGLNNVQMGDVVAVSEVIGNQNMPMYSVAEGRGGGTSVEPGEVTFTTQVQVVYAIK